MKNRAEEILLQEESTYKDLLLRKNMKLRIFETVVFVVAVLVLSGMMDSKSDLFKILALGIAVGVVALAPFLYKVVLRPQYTLTRMSLIVRISGQERKYPLSEVEQAVEGRHIYRLNGKRESLMVSRQFLAQLNERLSYFHKKGKR